MLTILNNYSNGYVAIPVILACKKHGLFKILNTSKSYPFNDLVKELHANSGHLRSALQILESLNWVSRNLNDEYLLSPESDIHQKIPEDIMELMSFPMNEYLNNHQENHRLRKWIDLSGRSWDVGNPMIAGFLDGMLVIPLLLALKENGLLNNDEVHQAPLFLKLNPEVSEEITEFFVKQGWLFQSNGMFFFTDAGRFMEQRIFITATVASYRPMLMNISEVIFGDCKSVFTRDLSNHELHVDRTLNVVGSGFQHQKYFSDMEKMILAIFNNQSYSEQPRYIADMGCGDGSLLKKIYEIIKDKSFRGKVLQEYPLRFIGIDYNEKALQETAHTLKDIDHIILQGDIGDPETVIANLKNMGIQDPENILHIRSFLDHDRPYIPPSNISAENTRSNIPSEAICVDREGNLIPVTSVFQSLVEHLQRWSGVLGKHGLIILEVHCLAPKIVSQFIDKCENLHFDAYHRFSQQLLVEAEVFLMAAAEAGLFPNQGFFRKYPKTLPFSRITLNYFERRPYQVRYAQENDLPALEQLEEQCWAPALRTPVSRLKQRIRRYPEGQLALEMNHKVVGIVYSQRITNSEDLINASIKTVEKIHQQDGRIVQLLGVNILPEMQHQNLGDQLLEFMLQKCCLMSVVVKVMGVTICKDYYKHDSITMEEYIKLRNERGKLVDPNLRFHELHGAQIKGLISNYRIDDRKNKGYGVLIEYDIYQRKRDDIQINGCYLNETSGAEPVELNDKTRHIKDFLLKSIMLILGKVKEDEVSIERPLMEMGLDSADLLELAEQIGHKYQLLLEPTFFFQHNTISKVISRLQKQIDIKTEAGSSIESASPKPEVQENYYKISQPANEAGGTEQEKLNDKTRYVKDFLLKSITLILGKAKEDEFSIERPLMEMGLDSADLLELNEQISHEYQISLNPTFFFEYNTPERIISYLQKYVDLDQKDDEPVVSLQDKQEYVSGNGNHKNTWVSSQQSDIAIIGISCRLPGSIYKKEQLWELLINNKTAIRKMITQRWSWPSNIDPDGKQKGIDVFGFLDDISSFEPLFFRISPKEAELMDPQQRIMLELSWECLEDAGYPTKAVHGSKTGVFIGACGSDYSKLLDRNIEKIEAHYGAGTSLAIIPNRISYFYDFHGPSIKIDTACSSSLVAIHEALESLKKGECEQALVGGVNIICHPATSISFYDAGMLSKDGKCRTFDKGADGYVRGEGAVMLLLKPIERAILDQDNIYAVIKGSAVNHGGQASGLTVPNPKTQADLLIGVYEAIDIEPETIGYIEAHGTGTSLGDPIEIRGLKGAFSQLSKVKEGFTKPYCGLGSIKTNIGHLEAAAGMAGLLKVVLSMQAQTLPASLNFTELNPNITLSQTPFYIVNKNQSWCLPEGQQLRRAGVSSFGFGGANAHIVLEEAPCITKPANKGYTCFLICLSARTEEVLRQKERDLELWLECNGKTSNLIDISATLLLGRDHFGIRAAYVVNNVRDLQSKLSEVRENYEAEGYFKESIAQKKQPIFEELGQSIIQTLFSDKKISRQKYQNIIMALAELYVKGYDLKWEAIFDEIMPPKISLPTYPFARERYWVPENINKVFDNSPNADSGFIGAIHPLLQQNTSDFSEQRYSSTFTGQEFFLRDHVVKGQRVLPGVAYLEMARAAVEKAAGETLVEGQGIRLKNVVWMSPLVVGDEPFSVNIGLYPEADGEIAYEIYSNRDAHEAVIYNQGSAIVTSIGEIPVLDLQELRNQCTEVVSAAELYKIYTSIGIDYGPRHQGVEEIYVGHGKVLAKLTLPASIIDSKDQYVLHPSIMDSALQAVIVLLNQGNYQSVANPPRPFALQELEIFDKFTLPMWAVIRTGASGNTQDRLPNYDIDLSDDSGKLCARIKGYAPRLEEEEFQAAEAVTATGTLMLAPVWKEKAVTQGKAADYERQLVIIGELNEVDPEAIQAQIPGARCVSLQSKQKGIDKRFQAYAGQVFEAVQSIIRDNPNAKALIQIIVSSQGEGWLLAGLTGLLKTARQENPKLVGQLLEVESREDLTGIVTKLRESSYRPQDSHIRYQAGKRLVATLTELETPETPGIPWRKGGIYLITGGSGGLGLLFANEMTDQVKEITLIMTGRSPLSEERQKRLQALEAKGARVNYRQVDVTDKKAVMGLIQDIQAEFGGLHGIIHSAGVIHDSYIIKKTKAELEAVLGPKVSGVVNLDGATKDLDLDFIVYFSSIASQGSPGQADYAMANAFMNAYAGYRNTLVAANERHGRTVAINWPLWQEGGMRVDAATEQLMTQNTGMIPLRTTSGIKAFYQSLGSNEELVIVMEGNLTRMRQKMLGAPVGADVIQKKSGGRRPEMKGLTVSQCLEWDLKQLIYQLLKIPREKIERNTNLEEFGFDSISLTEFATLLNRHYGIETITPAMFFGYSSIEKLSQYFLDEHQEIIGEFYREDGAESKAPVKEAVVAIRPKRQARRFITGNEINGINGSEPVAVIGMSGRFPKARTIDEFWEVLVQGKDAVEEIPAERFDWRQYYGDPSQGKTNCKWCGCIAGVKEFEPLFFEISPREAECTRSEAAAVTARIVAGVGRRGIW